SSSQRNEMHEIIRKSVLQLIDGRSLTADESASAVGAIMDGECEGVDIASFLTAIAVRGAVSAELVGAARAMRDRVIRIPVANGELLDTCGTGGDCLQTFNISTAAAIVCSASGMPVAKHGNRSVSSSSGSADVLEALGVNIGLTAEQAGDCLQATGIAFCFAPLFHGAMKHAAPIRRQLGIPTIFNLLGPLTNPAGAGYQLLGASSCKRATLLADALSQLATKRSLVVCGNDELDEVSLWGETTVFRVEHGNVERHTWSAASFELEGCRAEELRVGGPQESAERITAVLRGEAGPAARIVTANAAAGLLAAGRAGSPAEAAAIAANTISSGAALKQLQKLTEWTQALSK
ncbi:MAG: anthranilate phosphoribosyltransferase, partial [Planctomycetaceae bacterium]